jgi:hypothetical protein
VDIAHRGSLARPTPAISQSFYLLAPLTALGGTGSLAENLAHLPVAAGRRRNDVGLVGQAVQQGGGDGGLALGPELGKFCLLDASLAATDLLHCRGQVVVDQDGVDAAEKGKGMQMPV